MWDLFYVNDANGVVSFFSKLIFIKRNIKFNDVKEQLKPAVEIPTNA